MAHDSSSLCKHRNSSKKRHSRSKCTANSRYFLASCRSTPFAAATSRPCKRRCVALRICSGPVVVRVAKDTDVDGRFHVVYDKTSTNFFIIGHRDLRVLHQNQYTSPSFVAGSDVELVLSQSRQLRHFLPDMVEFGPASSQSLQTMSQGQVSVE